MQKIRCKSRKHTKKQLARFSPILNSHNFYHCSEYPHKLKLTATNRSKTMSTDSGSHVLKHFIHSARTLKQDDGEFSKITKTKTFPLETFSESEMT
uniref:Uncharacterized protein n=1 Tax=Anguilla anguilla TaxID=7936 RepID=A0A0E9WR26_ANGAN